MTVAIVLWLCLTFSLGVSALVAVWSHCTNESRMGAVMIFLSAAPLAFLAMQAPLGYADPGRLPPGEWRVLGARIDVDVAIYAMLDNGDGEPRLFRLPYSAGEADKLQQALDNTAGGLASGATIRADDQGEPEIHEEPVRGDEPKQAEQPMFGGAF